MPNALLSNKNRSLPALAFEATMPSMTGGGDDEAFQGLRARQCAKLQSVKVKGRSQAKKGVPLHGVGC